VETPESAEGINNCTTIVTLEIPVSSIPAVPSHHFRLTELLFFHG